MTVGGLVVFFLLMSLFVRPVWFETFTAWVGLNHYVHSTVTVPFVDKQTLLRENSLLRNQLQTKSVSQRLVQEHQRLYHALWNDASGIKQNALLAEILLRPPYAAYDYYLINQGINDGVMVNQLVVAAGQYVLGYIDQVTDQYSRVKLFSSSDVNFMVSIDGVLYPAEGDGGGVVHIRLPRDFRDTEAQIVRLPGGGPYVLGILETTAFRPQDSFVLGIMDMPVNIFQQEWVVVTPYVYTDHQNLEQLFNEE